MRRWLSGLISAVLAASVLSVVTAAHANADDGIVAKLKTIPGLTIISQQPIAGYQFFMLNFTQAIDHKHPNKGTFQQRLSLLHKSTDRPMVLQTTGYNVPEYAFRSEPTEIVDGNQISVEERFFTPSRPAPANWSDLDIWQAATDHHTIVQAFKRIYTKNWISTGASKGGMATVYHRRFYPNDVSGSVPYVAPNDVINDEDSAYDRFFQHVGSDAACRSALESVEKAALQRRGALAPKYAQWAADNGYTFTRVMGTADRAWESEVLSSEWAFWQYSLQSDCSEVPAPTASDDDILNFIDLTSGLISGTDQGLEPYFPYYFQAATQLGWPNLRVPFLKGLLRYDVQPANAALPPELRRPYRGWLAMLDVDNWVRHDASRLLFVYGQNDPWGAEPFRLGSHPHDSYSYTAAGYNHGSDISHLTSAETATATATVLRWAGVAAPATAKAAAAVPATPGIPTTNDPMPMRLVI
jgi:hypothetical protein